MSGVLSLDIIMLTVKIGFNLVDSFGALVHHVVELLQEGNQFNNDLMT